MKNYGVNKREKVKYSSKLFHYTNQKERAITILLLGHL